VRHGTFSVVARDPHTGRLGAAVASHWPAVGAIVPWVRAGVGAVCSQATPEPAHGPGILDRLSAGAGAEPALAEQLATDPGAASRQVAAVDAGGGAAAHTGDGAYPFAAHIVGDGFAVAANMAPHAGVTEAMATAFAEPRQALERRLLAALQAGQQAGGDLRGRQSAALLVAPPSGPAWARDTDLRVDDDPEPLVVLTDLLGRHEAYALADEGEALAAAGRHAEAAERYAAAAAREPESHELVLWAGLAQIAAGELDGGLERVRRALAAHPPWAAALPRFSEQQAPGSAAACAALGLEASAPQSPPVSD
jgi:uncharacterized Ntn-hydrolase superfamily protein